MPLALELMDSRIEKFLLEFAGRLPQFPFALCNDSLHTLAQSKKEDQVFRFEPHSPSRLIVLHNNSPAKGSPASHNRIENSTLQKKERALRIPPGRSAKTQEAEHRTRPVGCVPGIQGLLKNSRFSGSLLPTLNSQNAFSDYCSLRKNAQVRSKAHNCQQNTDTCSRNEFLLQGSYEKLNTRGLDIGCSSGQLRT